MLIICWDYDGTLVSSELVYKNIFMNYLASIGAVKCNITDEYYFKQYSGRHPVTVVKDLQLNGYVDSNIELSVEKWDKIFQDEIRSEDDLILSKNIINILSTLSSHDNIYMAIATSTHKNDYEIKSNCKSVAELKKFFDLDKNVYMAGEVGNKKLKPDPNVYLYAYNDIVTKNNVKNQNNTLVMIEDSESGCRSASETKKILTEQYNNIKAYVIGYLATNKFASGDSLANNGTNFIIYKPEDLEKLLLELAEKDKEIN